jgi:hypothetical protein
MLHWPDKIRVNPHCKSLSKSLLSETNFPTAGYKMSTHHPFFESHNKISEQA